MSTLNEVAYEATIGDHSISIRAGKLAGQAGGAVTVRSGDTIVLVTATASPSAREGTDFLPLTVDYEERLYAAGRIPGGFFKREGRPSEQAILLCRLTDRSLRPLFDRTLRNDLQVIITALSADQENYLDILSVIGASAALCISDIPFHGPIGAVRVGRIDDRFVFNPTASEMEDSTLNLRLAGTSEGVVMVEAGAQEASEDSIVEAITAGHRAMQEVIEVQKRMAEEIGKPTGEFIYAQNDQEVVDAVHAWGDGRVWAAMSEVSSKKELGHALDSLHAELLEKMGESYPVEQLESVFDEVVKGDIRQGVLREGRRLDGRDMTTVRPISCEVGLLPRAHGSGLFSRGETQVMAIATLGTASDEQILDGLGTQESKRFMHHYNFPPYSTGETRFLRAPKRREIGHGALAETALSSVIPSSEEFPYTIRLVSEVMSSNGSTSMASICASSLALMDAGVPLKAPVAGMAMGLITDGDRRLILTDIMGKEDAIGDMDFKVAGTRQGVTALQMDLKIPKIDAELLREALSQARDARVYALDRMGETISEAREDLSPYAPRITLLKIDTEKIGLVIGPGGKTIRKIIDETGVKIDVEDDGTVLVASVDADGSKKAVEMIKALTEDPEIGKIYTGTVRRLTDFGAFVEILPGRDGLVHVSQLADYHVPSVEDVVHVGDEIMVMVVDIDAEDKIRLSRRAVLEGWTPEQAKAMDRKPTGRRRPQSERRDGSNHRRRRH
jgi:polyribonucleotide nucleotidyltransferase